MTSSRAASADTEITLGTGKLLFLFFGLVGICALFFGLGYSLGRKADPGMVAAASSSPQLTSGGSKPQGSSTAQPMGFYKAVEQKQASAELTSAGERPADTKDDPTKTAAGATKNAPNSSESSSTLPGSSYFVQVAAVTKPDDAQALVDALRKKQYPALVANTAAADKFYRVQVGPFPDIKEAEAMRARLISDGYSPILKK